MPDPDAKPLEPVRLVWDDGRTVGSEERLRAVGLTIENAQAWQPPPSL